MVLCQLAEKLIAGNADSNELSTLYNQFYEALPHKTDAVKDSWTVRDVIVKKDFCQVCFKFANKFSVVQIQSRKIIFSLFE